MKLKCHLIITFKVNDRIQYRVLYQIRVLHSLLIQVENQTLAPIPISVSHPDVDLSTDLITHITELLECIKCGSNDTAMTL